MKSDNSQHHRSTLALVLLVLLAEKPMHPYRMQQLIKQRGKDTIVNVRQRASVYQTIERLERSGLIKKQITSQREGWPDKSVYEITEEGHATALLWLNQMLSEIHQEFTEFPVALASLPILKPATALLVLEKRAINLRENLAQLEKVLQQEEEFLARLFVLETEYSKTILEAELKWVEALIEDLKSGALTWSEEWLRELADQAQEQSFETNADTTLRKKKGMTQI